MKSQIRVFSSFWVFCCAVFQTVAQNHEPFDIRYESFVNGKLAIIGNNIINTSNAQHPNVSYDDVGISARLNDQMKMEYINIANSDDIFSASAADLIASNQKNSKVVYAGLYWAATYPYDRGDLKKNGKFYAVDKKRKAFDKVKLLLPKQDNYLEISGATLFDGLDNKSFKETAPYVAYADITTEIQKLEDPFGTYVVANIRASQGKIPGGAAGGWMLVFVLENPNENSKQIITYDGFRNVDNQVIDVNFTGFKTPDQGLIQARIAGAALEGDLNLKGDQLLFKTDHAQTFTYLNSEIRDYNNFFNSSITIDNDYFKNRQPNSLNTLGFDAFLMTIPNAENLVIPYNATQATLRLKSTTDSFFMFFTALEIESVDLSWDLVSESRKNKTDNVTIPNDTIKAIANEVQLDNIIDQNQQIAENKDLIAENIDPNESSKNKLSDENLNKQDSNNETIVLLNNASLKSNLIIPNLNRGFYLIVGSFLNLQYADAFIKTLNSKGYKVNTFDNPANNMRYLYIDYTNDYKKILQAHQREKDNGKLEWYWIAKINID